MRLQVHEPPEWASSQGGPLKYTVQIHYPIDGEFGRKRWVTAPCCLEADDVGGSSESASMAFEGWDVKPGFILQGHHEEIS